jgi:hypothetical protein
MSHSVAKSERDSSKNQVYELLLTFTGVNPSGDLVGLQDNIEIKA